jgi:hypothetical protein
MLPVLKRWGHPPALSGPRSVQASGRNGSAKQSRPGRRCSSANALRASGRVSKELRTNFSLPEKLNVSDDTMRPAGRYRFSAKMSHPKKNAAGSNGRRRFGGFDGFEPVPRLQTTFDGNDGSDRAHKHGLSEVRQRRSDEDGRGEMGCQQPRNSYTRKPVRQISRPQKQADDSLTWPRTSFA